VIEKVRERDLHWYFTVTLGEIQEKRDREKDERASVCVCERERVKGSE